jgi:DNA-directed RNA polymerase specialized sigma24 family protein
MGHGDGFFFEHGSNDLKPKTTGSITRCVAELKDGNREAARVLWERYFAQLVRVARQRRGLAWCGGAEADEEDAALSAFASFCAGAVDGQFPRMNDREELWRLLVVIAARKVGDQLDRARAQKRGGNRNRVEPASDRAWVAELPAAFSREPTTEAAAIVAEETDRLLDRLGDETLQSIALWRMEGHAVEEIAQRLGCTRRTVTRKVEMIRNAWKREPA